MTTPPAWEDRIVAYEAGVDPEQLLAHPLNARRHPGPQREALRESVGNIGWVAPVVANQQTGHLLDGHARVEEAITAGETVPVVYVDLTEDEERFVLATLDPISAMATYDFETVDLLLEGCREAGNQVGADRAAGQIVQTSAHGWDEYILPEQPT